MFRRIIPRQSGSIRRGTVPEWARSDEPEDPRPEHTRKADVRRARRRMGNPKGIR